MPGANVNKLTNANVYINGQNCLGMAEKVTVPRMKAVMLDHKGLGMVADMEYPVGLDKLELKITFASLYLEPETLLGSPFVSNNFQIRGYLQTFGAAGLTAANAAIFLISGPTKDMGDLEMVKFEDAKATVIVCAQHVEQFIGGRRVLLFDGHSNQFEVDGVDQLAQFRAVLGG